MAEALQRAAALGRIQGRSRKPLVYRDESLTFCPVFPEDTQF